MDSTLTIVSLMIGVFGATVSVVYLLRADCVAYIDSTLEDANTKKADIVDSGKKKTEKTARWLLTGMRRVGTASKYILLLPILCFALWAFSTSFYLSGSDDCKNYFSNDTNKVNYENGQEQDISGNDRVKDNNNSAFLFSRKVLFIVTVIDVVGIIVAIILWIATRALYKVFLMLHTSIREKESEGINNAN